MDIKAIIESGDAAALQQLLAADPGQANTTIRWGTHGENTCSPLHYICDKVFDRTLSDDAAVAAGPGRHRRRRRHRPPGRRSAERRREPRRHRSRPPAARRRARTDGRGLFGATALHWAAFIGDAVLVRRLLEKGAPTDIKDNKHESTPLGWAEHGRGKPTPPGNHGHHDEVIAALGGRS